VAEVKLPRDTEDVRVVPLRRVGCAGEPGPEVREVHLHSAVTHTLPEHIKDPPRVDLAGDAQGKLPHRCVLIPAVQFQELAPGLELSLADELPQRTSVNTQLGVVRPGRRLPAASQQLVFDSLLKRLLDTRSRTHAATLALAGTAPETLPGALAVDFSGTGNEPCNLHLRWALFPPGSGSSF
jgi:hypothetical protein